MPLIDPKNKLKHKLARGEMAFCMAVTQLRTANVAMIAAACGFDAIYIDLEHSPATLETTSTICIAALGAGVTPTARVTSHVGHDAARVLDGGAQGLMIPHVDTAEEAAGVVEHCLFPPIGTRSGAGSGPALAYRPMSQGEVNAYLNGETLLLAMLETPRAIENADAIAAVPGIDVLHIGSNDLCAQLGIPGQFHHPKLHEAYATAAKACRAHGKTLGVGGIWGDLELQTELARLGARYFVGGSDVAYLMRAARADLAALQSIKVE